MLFSFNKEGANRLSGQSRQEPSLLDARAGDTDLSDAQLAEVFGGGIGSGSDSGGCDRHFAGFEDFPFAGTGLLGLLFGPIL